MAIQVEETVADIEAEMARLDAEATKLDAERRKRDEEIEELDEVIEKLTARRATLNAEATELEGKVADGVNLWRDLRLKLSKPDALLLDLETGLENMARYIDKKRSPAAAPTTADVDEVKAKVLKLLEQLDLPEDVDKAN